MLLLLRSAALALAVSLPLLAQPLYFGEAVPLTHTRYGAFGAEPKLVTNGSGFFLFWATDSKVRVTRIVDGQKRAGRPVLDVDNGWFDVVWTGTHFLVAAYDLRLGAHEIRGRLVSASGDPVGDDFPIIARLGRPRLAFDGARVLMMYGPDPETRTLLLRADGAQATDPRHQIVADAPTNGELAARETGFLAATTHSASDVHLTTFDASGRITSTTTFTSVPVAQRDVAVASNGHDVLAVWTNGSNIAEGILFRANGSMSGRLPIAGTEGATAVAVAWNGTQWIISTIANGNLRSRILDGGNVHTQLATHAASPVSLAAINGRTFAAWRASGAGQSVIIRDLAGKGAGETAAFTSAQQTLLAATSSYDGALAVWSELRDGRHTLHAGLRHVDGSWREDDLGEDDDVPLASSDGNNFLLVKQNDAGWYAITVSKTIEVLASTQVISSFRPTGIAWNGSSWAVIGVSPQHNIYVVRVLPWGEVLGPVLIQESSAGHQLDNARIVWGGGTFLALWQDVQAGATTLRGTRLTEVTQRIDSTNLEIAPHEAASPDVYWDGNRYVIFWVNGNALETRTVRPNAAGSGITRIAEAQIDTRQIRATLTPFGTTIASNDGEVLLLRDNAIVTRYDLGVPNSADAVVNLGADVAYLQSWVRDEMPYHGSPHLMLRAGGVLPPDNPPLPPQIVRASMTDGGNLIVVEWTAPIDPVIGYRIEYRVDDGTWNELDEWFDATTTAISIRPWLEGVQYHFRLRAWSDAGVSDYSRAATVRLLGRRRSVR